MSTQKVWTKDEVSTNLKKDDVWVIRGIVAIFNYQTADEQASEETKEDNGVGFNSADANILSSFAKQIQKWNPDKLRTPLSPKQFIIARKKMVKYSGQLARIANGEI